MKLNGQNLKIIMAERIITTNELANITGLSRFLISNCIKGVANPKPATVGKIARALGVPVRDIIENAAATVKSE